LPRIIELEQHVADLIAAGEVVERPASVVKELVENSIDAGAGVITVEIASGGMTFIRVTDNGCGIASEDVKTAFLRHATSKLKNAQNLEAIDTLGFRGEALSAIGAVSRIELLTREPGADEGVSLTLEAGEVVDMSPVGCPEGTTIIVRNLFYNTPARKKFMKSDRAESSSIASIVLKCALSRPDISIRFIKDGKTEYHTPGDSRIDSCVYSLLGREIEAGFLNAESSYEDITVNGFVSSPSAARGNRSYQFFFINGRSIRSLLLQSALEQAYKNLLPAGRFPSCVLYVTTKPSDVDVNVHPAKTEVKFASDKQVFDGVYYAALGALDKGQVNKEGTERDVPDTCEGGWRSPKSMFMSSETRVSQSGFNTKHVDDFQNVYVSEPSRQYRSSDSLFSRLPKSNPDDKDFERASLSDSQLYNLGSPLTQSSGRFIGEVFNVYIVIEYQDSVWFIDKHAAHERIHFNALKNGDYESMSEALITPVICRLGHEDAALLLENAPFLDNLGFSIESFGEDAVAIRHVPAEIDISDAESLLSDISTQLKEGRVAKPLMHDNIFRAIACKAAIKAGRSSGTRELEVLATRVMSGEISHCPHGRPVAFEVTKSTLDKGFGRI